MHSANSFITLTYDNEHLPADLSLNKRHVQLFMKKLRKNLSDRLGIQVRFYLTGEYGDQNYRPHYHLILFGYDFADDRKVHSKKTRGQKTDILYKSDTLTKLWGMGHCSIGGFSYTTAAYTARYVMKKQNGQNAMQHENYSRLDPVTGELYQVLPEFSLMSRNPGIGSGWYEKYKADAFPSDFLIHEGKKHPVPRYYMDKLKKEDPDLAKQISHKRKSARESTAANNTSDRLAVREECKKAQLSTLKRSI